MICVDEDLSEAIKAAHPPKGARNYSKDAMEAFRRGNIVGLCSIITQSLEKTDPKYAEVIVREIYAQQFYNYGNDAEEFIYPREQIIHRAFEEAFLKRGIRLVPMEMPVTAYVLNCRFGSVTARVIYVLQP